MSMQPSQTQRPNVSLQVGPDFQLRFTEIPVPKPALGEVLVLIKAVGICGSDIQLWKYGGLGPIKVQENYTLGHEAAGVVLECGAGVTTFQPGDRVALESIMACDECRLCQSGKQNICDSPRLLGIYPTNGALQRYVVHPAKKLHKLSQRINYAEGALLEPLSVALQAVRDAGGIRLGSGALVCGAGAIGLCVLAAARASGAHPLVITDVNAKRLEFARSLVPECLTYQIGADSTSEENAKAIKLLYGTTEYAAPETVLECTGVSSSVYTGFHTVRKGGTVVLIGVSKSDMEHFPAGLLLSKVVSLKYSCNYEDTWPAGIACLDGGLLKLRSLVTHVYPFEKAMEAFEVASDPASGSIKVQIVDTLDD